MTEGPSAQASKSASTSTCTSASDSGSFCPRQFLLPAVPLPSGFCRHLWSHVGCGDAPVPGRAALASVPGPAAPEEAVEFCCAGLQRLPGVC